MYYPPRRNRRKPRQRKIRLCVLAGVLTVSISAAAFFHAEGSPILENLFEASEQAEDAQNDAQEEPSITVDDSLMPGKRASRTQIWLNPAQAKEGAGTPTFIALCIHEVRDDKPDDPLAVKVEDFRKIVQEFKAQGFMFLDSNDIIAIKNGKMQQPAKAVFLGFDDGYEDNYTNAFPIIRQEGVKATFFLVTGSIGKEGRMTVPQLKEMAAAGMCFGSHTVNHDEMDLLTKEQVHSALNDSKYTLEHDFGIKVGSFAYPLGYDSDTAISEAKNYYDIAFTASMDENTPDTMYTIHRFGVFRWNHSADSILQNK